MKLASHLKISIVAIQEHLICLPDGSLTGTVDVGDGWTLWLSTATAQGDGGVGFLFSPNI